MSLVWKLLRRHVSVGQLAGFFLANLIGMAIILVAVQFYRDVRPVIAAPDSFMSNDFLILSRDVGQGVRTDGVGFSREELDALAAQPFVLAVGEFTPARYSVTGGISFAGSGFYTYMFFESVPDRFLDVESDEWRFTEGDRTIPIILPRNYLNLYNFGFAATQGLPQMGEEFISQLMIDIEVEGGGRTQNFRGRIVAFSNRLNTILVPESFIEWSNARFADRPAADPSRIIVEVRNAADEALHRFLTTHGYRIEGDPGSGQLAFFMRMIAGVVAGVGLLVTALSLFIFMLSIFLLLQKNAQKLEDLLLAGYTPAQVARPYQLMSVGLNMLAAVCAIVAMLLARAVYMPMIGLLADGNSIGTGADVLSTIFAGLLAAIFVAMLNVLAIRRKVGGLWTQ
ncbi:MAG: ABC transporter permease [Rikenellaceae bacterium]|nr:ABC transporter permease [Rikenellaceae bacterium]MCL2692459.1 ABC transporter permease [Rikenellaceae bacterium]